MKNIIFIAPPAAGKGTQSAWLKEKYNYEHISTGDLLRNAIASKTPLGIKIEKSMAEGCLVSDEDVINLLKENLIKLPKEKPFILDGFPRTINQAQCLDKIFIELGIDDIIAIFLDINQTEAMHRALGRLSCPKCKAGYNKYCLEMQPKVEGVCDNCNIALEQRSDDNEESFKKRFATYIENAEPIINYYKDKNILKTLDADRDSDEVFKSIEEILREELK